MMIGLYRSSPGMSDDVGQWRSRCDVHPRSDVASSRRQAECPGTGRVSWAASRSVVRLRWWRLADNRTRSSHESVVTTGHGAVMSPPCLPLARDVVDGWHLQRSRRCPPRLILPAALSPSSEYETHALTLTFCRAMLCRLAVFVHLSVHLSDTFVYSVSKCN